MLNRATITFFLLAIIGLPATAAPLFEGGSGHYSIDETAVFGASVGYVKAIASSGSVTYMIADAGSPFQVDSSTGEITAASDLSAQGGSLKRVIVTANDGIESVDSTQSIFITTAAQASTHGLLLEHWADVSTTRDISDLIAHASYPDNPTSTRVISDFQQGMGTDTNYGQRISGYLKVPDSGNYTFWAIGDSNTELRLAQEISRTGMSAPISKTTTWVDPGDWDNARVIKSELIPLLGGRLYNIEALHKKNNGTVPHFAVTLQKEGDTRLNVIPASMLIPHSAIQVPPVIQGDAGHYVVGDQATQGTSVGFVKATDTNASDTLTYSLNDSSLFQINAVTGELTVIGFIDRSASVHHTLAVSVSDGSFTTEATVNIFVIPAVDANTTGIYLEHWTNISGNQVINLTSNPSYPSNPSQTSILTEFEAPSQDYGSYGQRVSGYLSVSESAEYTFWIASDNESELRLSVDTNPANLGSPIASVSGWTSPHQWTRFASQKSNPIYLVAGRLYYIEALHKEGSGGDHVAVALQKTGEVNRMIITGTQVIPPYILDSVAPTAPAVLGADSVSASSIQLAWNASSDHVGVNAYLLYRDGELIETLAGNVLGYIDNNVSANTTYHYQVIATDAFGHHSTAATLAVNTSNTGNAVETALQTGDARQVVNVNRLIQAAIDELNASTTFLLNEKAQLFNLNADGSAKGDGSSLTNIDWNPSHDAATLLPMVGENTTFLQTDAIINENDTVYKKSIGIIGNSPSRYMVLGGNPFRNAYRDAASLNAQMHQLMENSMSWLTARSDLKTQPFNVVIAHASQSFVFPDELSIRSWLDSHYSGQVSYNAADACDAAALAGCLSVTPDLLIISQYLGGSGDTSAIAAAVQQAMNNGIPVMYLHYDGHQLPLGRALFSVLNVSYASDNYWSRPQLVGYNITQEITTLPESSAALKRMLEHLRDADYAFDWSQCDGNHSCTKGSPQDTEFLQGAAVVRLLMTALDSSKRNIFAEDGLRLQKLLALIGDRLRQDVQYPMDKISTNDTVFMKSLYADNAAYHYRLLNPAQPDMGNYSRSDFSHVTPTTRTVNLISKKNFRSTGAYAIPGKTFQVTRNDSSDLTVHVFVSSLREGSTHLYQTGGYNRPKYLQSQNFEIAPGETIALTSTYGGPIQLRFSSNDLPVEVTFQNIGEHAYWSGAADDASFTAKIEAGDYDWAEISTSGFEVHSTLEKMRQSVADEKWGSAQALAAGTERYMSNFPHVLAGFSGPGIDVVPEIHNFAAAKGWSIDNLDLVKHMNADQASCGYGCSGNPYDAYWNFSPIGHGDVHELGHGLERPRFQFSGWERHSQTNPYSYYTKSKFHETTGGAPECQGIAFESAFTALQSSIGQANPSEYMQTNYWENSNWNTQVLMTIQTMMSTQKAGQLENGWHLLARTHIHDREFRRTNGNNWAAKKDSLGFSNYTHNEARSISNNDYMLIAWSTVVELDFRDYLNMWGIAYSDKAATQVASFNYPTVPREFFMSASSGYCKTGQNGDFLGKATLPVDGNQNWPEEIDDDQDGYWNALDNCPTRHNPRQSDSNDDGNGDMCAPYQLSNDSWRQISMPVDLGAQKTLSEVFADNLPADDYGVTWILFGFNAASNVYYRVELTDDLVPGVGYWAIQKTGSTVGIDLPISIRETPVQAISQCASPKGCFEISIPTQAGNVQWSMSGYPFEFLSNLSTARISANAGVCSDDDGCTLDEAEAAGVVHNVLFYYNGSGYESLSATSTIQSWSGFWAAGLATGDGFAPKLLMSLSE